jgi:peptide/nickel transport system substrate-binding protein
VEAQGEDKIVITLTAPFAPFLLNVSGLGIMSEAFTNAVGDRISVETCGTGPYYLSESVPEQRYVLSAFEDYHKGAARIKTMTIRVIADPVTIMVAFKNGDLDFCGVTASDWEGIKASGDFKTYVFDAPHVYYVVYNHEVPPFDNVKVRQAVNYAIDKESVNIIAFEGTSITATKGFVPPIVNGSAAPDNPYEYNPEKAKALLAEAGFADGFDLGTLYCLAGQMEKIAQVVAQNLNEVGIRCTIEIMESNALIERGAVGDFTMLTMGLGLQNDYHYWEYAFGSDYIGQINFARYTNPEVEELFDQGAALTDNAARAEIYKRIVNIVNDDAVYAPAVYASALYATKPGLVSEVSMRNGLSVYDWYWE